MQTDKQQRTYPSKADFIAVSIESTDAIMGLVKRAEAGKPESGYYQFPLEDCRAH